MPPFDRRDFVRTLAVAGMLTDTKMQAATEENASTTPKSGGPTTAPDVTRHLAQYLVSAKPEDLPEKVRQEAARTLLNWAGCAVGGSRHETVDIAVAALSPFSGPAQASILGRHERLDVLNAALMNGISSHIFDYDDTHLRTIIHPAGPVASAILALSEYRPVSGREFHARAGAGRRGRVPHRQRRLSRALRHRLAHHRNRGRIRLRGGRRQTAGTVRAADGVGAGPRRHAAGGTARDVRHHDQELSPGPRRAERPDRGAAGARATSPAPTSRSRPSAVGRTC